MHPHYVPPGAVAGQAPPHTHYPTVNVLEVYLSDQVAVLMTEVATRGFGYSKSFGKVFRRRGRRERT